jgi:hypothetical protein
MEPPDSHARWAARRGHLRASDADRELVIDALKTAFVQGRLSRSELASRAGRALESRTYAGLAEATAGIPAVRPAPVPAPSPAPDPARCPDARRRVNRKRIAWAVAAIIGLPGLGVAFFATYYGSFFILLLLGLLAATVVAPAETPAADRHSVY